MASTINCVVCFEKADCFGGHVHDGEGKIIAGFCREHFRKQPQIDGCKGCYGNWKPEMGTDGSFGQLGFIDKDGFHPID